MSIENLNEVNTVSDLLQLQKNSEEHENQPSAADDLMVQVLNEDPAVGLELAQRVLFALRDLHQHGVDQYKEEGNIDAAAVWYADAVLLDQCLTILKDIQL